MVFPQIILQTFALSKRYSTISNENRRLQSKLLKSTEQYSQNLINGLEKERKRLAGEFHDSIGQNLLVIRNRILMMIKKEKEPKQQEKLEGLAQLTAETLDEIRTISQNLRPTTLDTVGLTITIQNMMERVKNSTEIAINYTCEGSIDRLITKEHEINIYRILQELLNNIIKHSKASQADVHIFSNNKMLIILVNDNGIGFEEKITLFGNGLSSIHERLNIMKGKMHIESRNGSHITIQIPTTNE
jgi:signal transduction histidine kinase